MDKFDLEIYTRCKNARDHLVAFTKSTFINAEERRNVFNEESYTWDLQRTVPEFYLRYGKRFGNRLLDHVKTTQDEIQTMRMMLRKPRRKSVIERNADTSKTYAENTLKMMWPKYNWRTNAQAMNGDACNASEEANPFRVITVTVAPSWHKQVYKNDFEIVTGGSGKYFIMHMSRVSTFYTDQEDIIAFRARALQMHKNKLTLHDGWVVTHDNLGESMDRQVAFGWDFAKAHSLLRRRIKDAVLRKLDQ